MATNTQTPASKRYFYWRYVEAAKQTGNRLWNAANAVTGGYVAYLAQAFQNFMTKGASEAVIFGYWSVFSLFPLVMLAVVVATFALGPESARYQVYRALNEFVPGAGVGLIRENINQAIDERGGFGIIGIIGLIYGATGLFTNLQANLSRIFRDKKPRSLPAQILVGIIMMIVLATLTVASILASFMFSEVGGHFVGQESPWLSLGAAVVPMAINTLAFFLLFRFIPRRNIVQKAIWPAALFAALGWELVKNFFGWYTAHLANYGLVYGSLGTVIGLLTWTYLTGCFISLCAEIAVATDDWLAKRPPAIAIVVPCVNKPADEVSPNEPGQVVRPEKVTPTA